jgi:hypothetical protein
VGDVHGVDPVDEGLVRLGDDREPALLEAFDEVDLPQRAVAVERAWLDPCDKLLQLLVVARLLEGGPPTPGWRAGRGSA